MRSFKQATDLTLSKLAATALTLAATIGACSPPEQPPVTSTCKGIHNQAQAILNGPPATTLKDLSYTARILDKDAKCLADRIKRELRTDNGEMRYYEYVNSGQAKKDNDLLADVPPSERLALMFLLLNTHILAATDLDQFGLPDGLDFDQFGLPDGGY